MLLDPSGNLIWFQPLPANQLATDFRVQQLDGQPVLTWWQGYTNNGSGRGEGRDLQHVLPADRHRAGGQRPAGHGPARVPGHAAGRCLRRRRLPDPLERHEEAADGRGRPGDRHQDRAGAVRVARDRPHPDQRLVLQERCTGRRVRPLPPELDRARHRRQPDRLAAQHLGGLQDQPSDGRGDVDARLQPEQLQDGRRHADRLPARRRAPAERNADDVRRRRRAAAGAHAVAGDRGVAQRVEQHRDAGQAVRALAGAERELRGRRAGSPRGRPVRRVGAAALLLRVQLIRAAHLRCALHVEHLELSRLQVRVERAADDAAGCRRGPQQRRHHPGVAELERRDRRSRRGGCWRDRARARWRRS